MNISEGLFAFLLFLAVIPAYVFAFYGLYISRVTSSTISKMLEQDMNHALGTLGGNNTPIYQTSLSMQDLAKVLKLKDNKEKEEKGTPQATGGQYI